MSSSDKKRIFKRKIEDWIFYIDCKRVEAHRKVKNTIIRLVEIITRKKLSKIIASKKARAGIVRYIDRVNNVVSMQDLESGRWTTVEGTGVADDVQYNTVVYA